MYPQDGYYEKEEFSGPNEVEEREDVDLNDLFDPKIIGKYYR